MTPHPQTLAAKRRGDRDMNTNPETKFEQIRGALIAMLMTIAVLPILGIWAIAAKIENLIIKKGG